jgi:Cysteine-rich CWC
VAVDNGARDSVTKVCPLCGSGFECAEGHPGCWCEGVSVPRHTLAELRANVDGCLCRACLTSLALRPVSRRDAAREGA